MLTLACWLEISAVLLYLLLCTGCIKPVVSLVNGDLIELKPELVR